MKDATPHPDVLTRARELRGTGVTYAAIAETLGAEGYPTVRGGKWTSKSTRNLLARRRPNVARFAPCDSCGRLTAAGNGVCARMACRPAYDRARAPIPLRPTAPCSLCGRLTTSPYGVCTQGPCYNEYRRRERIAQKGEPSVYAVWFPSPCVLKVGFTAHTSNHIFTATARSRAGRRGWDAAGSSCIWKQPGDMRTEAWMQATLAFRWRAAFEKHHGTLCEWFKVPASAEGGIAEILDHIYGQVPADLTG